MPPIVLKGLVCSMNVKHVLELAPSTSTAAAWLIGEYGASYCCIASTETSATWFRQKVHDDLIKMCSQEGTKLYTQCQIWAGMDGEEAKNNKGHPVQKRKKTETSQNTGGGGERPKKHGKKAETSENTGGQSGGGNGTGGGALDIGALLAAAKAKAKGDGKANDGDGDNDQEDE